MRFTEQYHVQKIVYLSHLFCNLSGNIVMWKLILKNKTDFYLVIYNDNRWQHKMKIICHE